MAQNSQGDSLTITGRVVDNKHQPMAVFLQSYKKRILPFLPVV